MEWYRLGLYQKEGGVKKIHTPGLISRIAARSRVSSLEPNEKFASKFFECTNPNLLTIRYSFLYPARYWFYTFKRTWPWGQVLSNGSRLTTRDPRPQKEAVAHATAPWSRVVSLGLVSAE